MSPAQDTPGPRGPRRAAARTPYELLAARPDRSRPFVTSYDGPHTCVELSVASTLNGVAKAAGLLRDELDLSPGDLLSIDLPLHWQLPVWTLAGLSAGLVVGRELPERVAVRIVGPAGLAALREGADARADEVLGCACDAFGMPVPGGVPAGVLDVGTAVRAHPDVFQADPAAAGSAGLLGSALPGAATEVAQPWPSVLAQGARDPDGARTWVSAESLEAAGLTPSAVLRRAAIDPLLCSGSVVLARGLSGPDEQRARSAQGVADPAL